MHTFIIQKFQNYALFSMQVDQYYAAVRIYARNHDSLKNVFHSIPSREEWPTDQEKSALPDSVKRLFISSASAFNHMGTTGLFSETAYPEFKNLPEDMINFGFYTCFCFQWTLFENFVKSSVLYLVAEGLLPNNVCHALKKRERATAQFFKYLDSDKVFEKSPFVTVLPVKSWTCEFEKCNFDELNKIRNMRNQFIHAVNQREILDYSESVKEYIYERSMWIMRKFGENIAHEIKKIFDEVESSQNLRK